MEILLYFLVAGFVMALLLVPVVALYSTLEANSREREIKRLVHKRLIEQLRAENELEERNKRITL